MAFAGLVVTLLGFAIAVLSLGVTQSMEARLGIVLIGFAVSLFGIVGLLNPAYLKNVIWRKE
jgi:hypothetical protein